MQQLIIWFCGQKYGYNGCCPRLQWRLSECGRIFSNIVGGLLETSAVALMQRLCGIIAIAWKGYQELKTCRIISTCSVRLEYFCEHSCKNSYFLEKTCRLIGLSLIFCLIVTRRVSAIAETAFISGDASRHTAESIADICISMVSVS